MRKYHSELNDNKPKGGRSRVPAAIAFGLALLASPLVYEGGQILVSRWMLMAGTYRAPRTPILDAFGEWSRSVAVDGNQLYNRFFNSGTWSPSTAIPLGIGWAVLIAVFFLNRSR